MVSAKLLGLLAASAAVLAHPTDRPLCADGQTPDTTDGFPACVPQPDAINSVQGHHLPVEMADDLVRRQGRRPPAKLNPRDPPAGGDEAPELINQMKKLLGKIEEEEWDTIVLRGRLDQTPQPASVLQKFVDKFASDEKYHDLERAMKSIAGASFMDRLAFDIRKNFAAADSELNNLLAISNKLLNTPVGDDVKQENKELADAAADKLDNIDKAAEDADSKVEQYHGDAIARIKDVLLDPLLPIKLTFAGPRATVTPNNVELYRLARSEAWYRFYAEVFAEYIAREADKYCDEATTAGTNSIDEFNALYTKVFETAHAYAAAADNTRVELKEEVGKFDGDRSPLTEYVGKLLSSLPEVPESVTNMKAAKERANKCHDQTTSTSTTTAATSTETEDAVKTTSTETKDATSHETTKTTEAGDKSTTTTTQTTTMTVTSEIVSANGTSSAPAITTTAGPESVEDECIEETTASSMSMGHSESTHDEHTASATATATTENEDECVEDEVTTTASTPGSVTATSQASKPTNTKAGVPAGVDADEDHVEKDETATTTLTATGEAAKASSTKAAVPAGDDADEDCVEEDDAATSTATATGEAAKPSSTKAAVPAADDDDDDEDCIEEDDESISMSLNHSESTDIEHTEHHSVTSIEEEEEDCDEEEEEEAITTTATATGEAAKPTNTKAAVPTEDDDEDDDEDCIDEDDLEHGFSYYESSSITNVTNVNITNITNMITLICESTAPGSRCIRRPDDEKRPEEGTLPKTSTGIERPATPTSTTSTKTVDAGLEATGVVIMCSSVTTESVCVCQQETSVSTSTSVNISTTQINVVLDCAAGSDCTVNKTFESPIPEEGKPGNAVTPPALPASSEHGKVVVPTATSVEHGPTSTSGAGQQQPTKGPAGEPSPASVPKTGDSGSSPQAPSNKEADDADVPSDEGRPGSPSGNGGARPGPVTPGTNATTPASAGSSPVKPDAGSSRPAHDDETPRPGNAPASGDASAPSGGDSGSRPSGDNAAGQGPTKPLTPPAPMDKTAPVSPAGEPGSDAPGSSPATPPVIVSGASHARPFLSTLAAAILAFMLS
ncbi:hypothetical protein JDV02_005052 [Purpureocillium takamizusanense]|uniref:Uncharacterized protein n=1 Tax=Purpureocillium takamizusanense TaxID=2060973 RepID=A0A9Q8QFM9_9HYPO|nr:uncharacterized protein JDV02_005052 [Purpureocillium takamizusanense]UNI18805.1 hypothetical protein JDV02_005052 [Purpureocillium takamizusanense]